MKSEKVSDIDKKTKKRIMLKQKKFNFFKILLYAWLILILVGNILTAVAQIGLNAFVISEFPNVQSQTFYLMGFFALVNVIAIIFMLMQKKVGYYAYLILAIIIFIANLQYNVNIWIALLGFIPLVITSLLMIPNWRDYR